jgi:hypothetical protein
MAGMHHTHRASAGRHPNRLIPTVLSGQQGLPSALLTGMSSRGGHAPWSQWLCLVSLMVATVTVLLWHTSLVVLGFGAIVLAQALVLALLFALARRGRR